MPRAFILVSGWHALTTSLPLLLLCIFVPLPPHFMDCGFQHDGRLFVTHLLAVTALAFLPLVSAFPELLILSPTDS
jgi:hypothetical protein